MPSNEKRRSGLMLITLAMLLTGCASSSLSTQAKVPGPPAFSEPESSQSYLQTALENIEIWQKRLTDSIQTEEN